MFFLGGGGQGQYFSDKFNWKKTFSGKEHYNCFRSTFSELTLGRLAYMQVFLTTKIPITLPIFRRVSTIGGAMAPLPPPPPRHGATAYIRALCQHGFIFHPCLSQGKIVCCFLCIES
jgi:hypothetical protein